MRYVVDIRECRSNQDVSLALFGEFNLLVDSYKFGLRATDRNVFAFSLRVGATLDELIKAGEPVFGLQSCETSLYSLVEELSGRFQVGEDHSGKEDLGALFR